MPSLSHVEEELNNARDFITTATTKKNHCLCHLDSLTLGFLVPLAFVLFTRSIQQRARHVPDGLQSAEDSVEDDTVMDIVLSSESIKFWGSCM